MPKLEETSAATPPSGQAASGPSVAARVLQGLRFLQVRARFIAVLAVIALVIGQWERITGYWNWCTRQLGGVASHETAVSADTEFFCPMDPGVVSAWEDKCPICNMTLVRRKKGDARLLPEGVVARMQFSPYRLQLAGIQTAVVSYRPLARQIEALGFVAEGASPANVGTVSGEDPATSSGLWVEIQLAERDLPLVSVDQTAKVASRAAPDGKTYSARVVEVRRRVDARSGVGVARLRIEDSDAGLPLGALASVRLETPLADVEPYRSLPRNPPPPRKNDVRVAYVSASHPEILRDKPGLCPLDGTDLLAVPLTDNQRLSWWCPMHPKVVADEDGHECQPCAGMKLLPRIVTYSPPGQLLAVGQAAVINVGSRNLVYVEVAPGMFDGVFVELGTRCGDYYPVLKGLSAGQRVAASGAFLIDAETRLSANASTGYFGASAGK